MAIKIVDTYPGRAAASSPDYPNGAFRNQSAPGAGDGSYPDEDWANDWLGFQNAMLARAGITPSGNPDTALESQLLQAVESMILYYLGFSRPVKFAQGLSITTRTQTVIDAGKVYWWTGTLPHTTGASIGADANWQEVRAAIMGKDATFAAVQGTSFNREA